MLALLDSDGSWQGNRYTITLTNKTLAFQTKYLADSLGFRTRIRDLANGYYKNGRNGGAWVVTIGGDTWRIPCRVARKQSIPRDLKRSRLTSVLSIKYLRWGKYFGFETDGDHLFLLADGTVAHNCQLPPIKAPFAFEADCWEHFERNTTKLTKAWRQANPVFLEAINAAREGQGRRCAEILTSLGVRFTAQNNGKFQGTTIMAKNDAVDNFNYAALMDLKTEPYGLKRATWMYQGQSDPSEWKNIPEVLKLKDGAYVMILSNDTTSGEFLYANGDCGIIQGKDLDGTVWIKLKRTEKLVGIKPIVRYKTMRGDDAEKLGLDAYKSDEDRVTHLFCDKECGWDPSGIRFGPWGKPRYNCSTGSWNIGAIRYYPLRLAYATTVHKSQGLTLDNCQIDVRDRFFGSPNMAYVALSRCRTAEGLTIVGEPGKLAERIVLEPKVRRWL